MTMISQSRVLGVQKSDKLTIVYEVRWFKTTIPIVKGSKGKKLRRISRRIRWLNDCLFLLDFSDDELVKRIENQYPPKC